MGTVKYELSSIQLNSLTLPSNTISVVPNVGLSLVISDSSSHVSFDWHYSSWLASDSGTGDVSISDTGISIEITITDQNGALHLSVDSASVDIKGFNLDLHGGASWLYDLFIDLFKGDIKNSIQSALQSALVEAVNTNANIALSKIPLKQNVGCCIYLSYALTQNPVFTSTYLTASENGEFYDIANPTTTPYAINALPDIYDTEMLQIFFSGF